MLLLSLSLNRSEGDRQMSAASSLKRKGRKAIALPPMRVRAAQPAERTYWNGEPTPCRRVVVRVGTVPKPTWWCAGLEGTERKAVEVNYGAQRCYLDNENGSAWGKVTGGM